MRVIRKIIIHYTETPLDRKVTVDEIRKWHTEERGWSDIGYHYIIYFDGTLHDGRPVEKVGAHCAGQNKDSIGVCYIGGIDEEGKKTDTRTLDQKEALRDHLMYLKGLYPEAVVYGHNDFSDKDCPGFDAKKEYEDVSNLFEEA